MPGGGVGHPELGAGWPGRTVKPQLCAGGGSARLIENGGPGILLP